MKKGIRFIVCILMCIMVVSSGTVSTYASGNPPVCDHQNNMYHAFDSEPYVYDEWHVSIGGHYYLCQDIWINKVYRCPICGYERVKSYHVRYDYIFIE